MEIEIIAENSKVIPTRAHEHDAGWDLRVNCNTDKRISVDIPYDFKTGIRMNIPEGYVGLVVPRSGMGSKYQLNLRNTVGVIDSGYQGEIEVRMLAKKTFKMLAYERFAQIVIVPIAKVDSLKLVQEFKQTDRGEGGFGSSDKEVI